MKNLPDYYSIHPNLIEPLRLGLPIVALESAVITHGLPYPENLQLALSLEEVVRAIGASAATIGIINKKIKIGLTENELETLALEKNARKISRRDFAIALTRGEIGGTTVAGTLIAARTAGIRVFATGGIGGVHRGSLFDISADLPELSRSPMIVVCAGAKSILDLPATLEYLETMGVPVVGYQTNEFPAFFSRESGLGVNIQVNTVEEIVQIALTHWELGIESAVLVVNPPPLEVALPADRMNSVIQKAVEEAQQKGIHGSAVTPYLLAKVSQLTGGESLSTNLELLRGNARLAAEIALLLARNSQKFTI